MAFFTPSCLISEIRGSVGDQTFSRNKYGPIVKQKLTQPPSSTARQVTNRNRLANCVSAWQGLTEAQRQQWIQFAKSETYTDSLGQEHTYAGYHLFVKLNLNLQKVERPIIQAPVPKRQYPSTTEWFTVAEFGEFILTVNTNLDDSSWYRYQRVTAYISPSIKSLNPSIMRAASGSLVYSSNMELSPFVQAVALFSLAQPAPGDTIWFSLQAVDGLTGFVAPTMFWRFVWE